MQEKLQSLLADGFKTIKIKLFKKTRVEFHKNNKDYQEDQDEHVRKAREVESSSLMKKSMWEEDKHFL